MKIEIIIGSPRKYGNTFTLANHLNDLLNCSTRESNLIFLYDYEIKPCIDCRMCKTGEMKCSIEDELETVLKRIEIADILVFGTPIYWFAPTAKTKLLLDRFRPYFVNKKLYGKKAAVILCASAGKNDCDFTIEMFRRIFKVLKIEYLGCVISKSYEIGDAAEDYNANNGIRILSQKILTTK